MSDETRAFQGTLQSPFGMADLYRVSEDSYVWFDGESYYSSPAPVVEELKAQHRWSTYVPKVPAGKTPKHEVEHNDVVQEVTKDLWDAWTGRRFVDGEEFHGPVVHYGSQTPWKGVRSCPCETCQSTVEPALRMN